MDEGLVLLRVRYALLEIQEYILLLRIIERPLFHTLYSLVH
ncbi:hypothetical protein VAEKB19_5030024 [Vibrio aestuarianus]|nr:hypothetical protein VAEKB19_5030024 [Vibrio aestuarianus]